MKIAEVVAQRSTCIKRRVGAVLVKDSHIISTGYNGAPVGFKHCTYETCVRKELKSGEKPELCRGVHAEMACLKLIINAGINKLVYKEGYNMENKVKEELYKQSSLIIEKF